MRQGAEELEATRRKVALENQRFRHKGPTESGLQPLPEIRNLSIAAMNAASPAQVADNRNRGYYTEDYRDPKDPLGLTVADQSLHQSGGRGLG